MQGPLFSIVIANYNHALYITECITSVIQQTFSDFECIIVDDGSTDESVLIAQALIEVDTRFKLVTQKNSGVAQARNTGMQSATGNYLIFLDSDDLLSTYYLEEANFAIENKPDFFLFYTGAEFTGNKRGKWELPTYDYKKLLLGSNMIYLTTVIRREDALKAGGFGDWMSEGWEDWEFYVRLLHGVDANRVIKSEKYLFYYRIKNFSRSVTIDTSTDVRTRMMNECFIANSSIYREYFPNFIDSLSSAEYYTNLSRTNLFKLFFKFKLLFN